MQRLCSRGRTLAGRAAPIALAALAAIVTTTAPGRAGSPAPGPSAGAVAVDLTRLSLEQLMELPVQTVVTATRHQQKTTEAPAQATVVTAADIRAYGHRTLADILRSVPGFFVATNRAYGFVGVRGFGRPGDFGGRILLLLDGHRMNDPLYDYAAVLNDFIVDVALIDRVEVVRGPGSALYGNNAFFAVVNVITRRAGQIGRAEVSAEAGTWDSYRGRASLGLVTAGGTEAVLSASAARSDGNPELHYPDYASPGAGDGLARGGDGERAASVFASLRRGGLALEAAYVDRDKDDPSAAYGQVFGEVTETTDRRGLVEARYEAAPRPDLQASFRLAYDWYEFLASYWYDYDGAGDPAAYVENRDESTSETLTGAAQLAWSAPAGHRLTLGAEYRSDFRGDLRNFDVSPRADYLDVDASVGSFGVYLQDEFRPLPDLAVTLGLRYDRFDTFGDTWNPRAALVWDPAAGTAVKLLYGTAFRAPNAMEFFYEDDGLSTKLNPGLDPETVSTWEVVLEQRLGRSWRGSLAGFASTVKNLIDTVQDPADGLYYSDNIAEVDARGVEAQLEGQLAADLRGRASYTWNRTEDAATGERLSNSPAHLVKANVTAPLIPAWLFAAGELQYQSGRTTFEGRALDEVWLVNVNVFTGRLGGVWELSFDVHNLLDEKYFDPALSPDRIEQDGRTVRFTAVARF